MSWAKILLYGFTILNALGATKDRLDFPPIKGGYDLLVTPNPKGHPEFVDAILESDLVWITMFHLTDPEVVTALVKANDKKADVRVILDGESLKNPRLNKSFQVLKAHHVKAIGSSKKFTITHEKAMIVHDKINGKRAFITSINLTRNAATTRDLGLVLRDPTIISEMEAVFLADWKNAESDTELTPALTQPNLVWSPVNSQKKISTLISSAHRDIIATVENLGDRKIMNAMKKASAAHIRLITPQCDENANPLYNYRFLEALKGAVQSRVMPYPATEEHPYMHLKMILVDHEFLYIGSVNFSNNSTSHARELGIVLPVDEATADKISGLFEQDWAVSLQVPSKDSWPRFCPKL